MKAFITQLRSRLARLLFSQGRPPAVVGVAVPPEDKTGSLHADLKGEALEVARQLTGKTLHIPDLRSIFADWPLAANKHLEKLERLVDATLERVITNERKLQGLKRANFALLIALWYPHAEWEELAIATYYSIWIFIWDDEVDAGDTDVSTDEQMAHAYSKQSREFVHKMLGLDVAGNAPDNTGSQPDGVGKTQAPAAAPHQNMVLFTEVGRTLNGVTDSTQRQRFFKELEHFMIQVGIEHSHRLRGSIPTVEKYLEIRSGSVGCAPQIAITDYMLKMRLPESIMESAPMKSLWNETVLMCLVLNDIYSAQKEKAQGSLFNLVPVMFKNLKPEDQTLDAVTDQLMDLLKNSTTKFELAAVSLIKLTTDDSKAREDTAAFIEWCRYFITGVLDWSLKSRRYGMAQCVQNDQSVDVVL